VDTRQLQVECRTGKVCRSRTDVLPLCHATNRKRKLNNGSNSDLELHAAELVHGISHVVADDRPRYLVVALSRRLHRVARHVVEPDYVPHHTNGLEERAPPAISKQLINY